MRARVDPMESGFMAACDARNIKYEIHDKISGLDFYLPEYDIYVEVKQFHSARIAEQMSRRPEVIAIQGKRALAAFVDMLAKPLGVA